MVKITGQLKTKLEEARHYLNILANPLKAEGTFDGVFAVRDGQDDIIPGALCYRASNEGLDVAILGGIHMNEMSGIYALLKFHHRWLNGVRPKAGKIYVATGKIERALEFIDTVMKADNIAPEIWSAFHATTDHHNYNRVPFDILTRNISNDFEHHVYKIVKYILSPVKGRVLDLHNTSTDAAPMVTMFMQDGETPEKSIARINATGVTKNLPVRDFIVWKPGPYNGMESIRSIIGAEKNAIAILVENGGGADPGSFDAADVHTQIWLENLLGMEPEESVKSITGKNAERNYYVETHALYHPDVKPQDYAHLDAKTLAQAQQDTFVLIRDWASASAFTGWSPIARAALNRLADERYAEDRLNNFMPIKKGDILAIGQNTGLELRSPCDGVVMMVGASPLIKSADRETFANIGAL